MDYAEKGMEKKIATVEEMRQRKKEYGFSYEELSKRAGLPLGTVQKVLGGFSKNPRHATLAALTKALFPEYTSATDQEKHPGRKTYAEMVQQEQGREAAQPGLLAESAPSYGQDPHSRRPLTEAALLRDGAALSVAGASAQKHQGEYTIEDRNALPEDYPSELIDGVIFSMASPTFRHQTIAGAIYRQLWNFVDANGGGCMPFIAPTDVRLDRDDYTMLVPDVFVVCHPDDDKMGDERYINGAPDLVIEVLSPSTRRKDMFVKLNKYHRAGVREYWIVDPQKEKVIVYRFEGEPEVSLFGFDSEVPVAIYDNACRIDFQRVRKDLRMAHLT